MWNDKNIDEQMIGLENIGVKVEDEVLRKRGKARKLRKKSQQQLNNGMIVRDTSYHY